MTWRLGIFALLGDIKRHAKLYINRNSIPIERRAEFPKLYCLDTVLGKNRIVGLFLEYEGLVSGHGCPVMSS